MQITLNFCGALVGAIVHLADGDGVVSMKKVEDFLASRYCSECEALDLGWRDMRIQAKRLESEGGLRAAGVMISGGNYVLNRVKGKCDERS